MARTTLSYQDFQDDDDKLKALLEQGQGLGGGAPDEPPPQPQLTAAVTPDEPPPQQYPDTLGDPSDHLIAGLLSDPHQFDAPARSPKSDPELEAARRDAEMSALHQANFDKGGYGIGEFARDNGAALLASVLDIGFNKGRGLGGIVGATANEVGKQEAARLQRAKEAGEFATKLHPRGGLSPEELAIRERQLAINEGNLGLRGTQIGNVQNRYDTTRGDKIDPNSQLNQTREQMAGRLRASGTRADLDTRHELNPRTAEDKAAISAAEAGASTGARINTEGQLADTSANTAATIEGAKETAQVGANRAAQAAGRPVPKGFAADDQALFDNANSDPAARGKMLGDTMTARQLAEASSGLAQMRAKNGPQWMPSQGSGEYDALHLAVVGAANRVIADAGTLNQGERELMTRLVPGVTPNWKDFAGWMAGADLNANELEGFAKGLQTVINSRAASYGLRYVGDQQQQQLAAPGAASMPPMAAPRRPSARVGRQSSLAPAQPGELGPPEPAGPIGSPSEDFMQRYEQYKRQREAQP